MPRTPTKHYQSFRFALQTGDDFQAEGHLMGDCDPRNWLIFRWRPGEALCGKIVGFNEEHVIVDITSPDGGPEFWGQTQVKPAHVLTFGSEKLVRAALREIRTDLGKEVSEMDERGGEAFELLAKMRRHGWHVAVHNDYRIDGVPHTFWLFTNERGRAAKGEGRSDFEALERALEDSYRVLADDIYVCDDCGETVVHICDGDKLIHKALKADQKAREGDKAGKVVANAVRRGAVYAYYSEDKGQFVCGEHGRAVCAACSYDNTEPGTPLTGRKES